MARKRSDFIRGTAVGLAIGLVLGGTGVVSAAFAKKGWERFGKWFQEGYIAGFVDCVRIAQALNPHGYVATNFKTPEVKPTQWRKTIDELYAQKEHENRTMAQMMVIAGHKLTQAARDEKTLGDLTPAQLKALARRREAAVREAKEAVDAASKAPAAGSGEALAKSGKKGAGAKKQGKGAKKKSDEKAGTTGKSKKEGASAEDEASSESRDKTEPAEGTTNDANPAEQASE